MTMIACTMNVAAPIIIGDLLISSSVKPEKFVIPSLSEDVLQYLSSASELHPVWLNQKIYILKSNVCIAFAGSVFHFKRFLEDIRLFCKVTDPMTAEEMQVFLNSHEKDETWKHFSFLMLVVDKEENHLRVGKVLHGEWCTLNSPVYQEVFASGSGSIDFLKETISEVNVRTQFSPEDIEYTMQVNIIMICKLLARERATLFTVKQHWGAGFEMVYFNQGKFSKVDEITYVINHGKFDEQGNVDVPIPAIILNYKYHGDVLVITVVKPNSGETEETDTSYIIRSKNFGITQFIVVPIDYNGTEDFSEISKNPSFFSTRNAMGYIIESGTGYYLPASFHPGPELTVNYCHPDNITITMLKGINDILLKDAKEVFPNLKP